MAERITLKLATEEEDLYTSSPRDNSSTKHLQPVHVIPKRAVSL